MTTFREIWARSARFGQNGGWDESRGARVFLFGKARDFATTSERPIFTKFRHEKYFRVPSRNPERHCRKFSTEGSFAPKIWNRKSVKQAPNSEQATGHVMHCRDILFHVVAQGPGSFQGLVNFCLRRTVAELRGVKVAKFSDFGLFSPYKTPKTYLPETSLQPRGYIAECLRFFHVVDAGPSGCLPAAEFSAISGRGAGDPQTCLNFRLRQIAISIQTATARCVRSGPKMSENAHF